MQDAPIRQLSTPAWRVERYDFPHACQPTSVIYRRRGDSIQLRCEFVLAISIDSQGHFQLEMTDEQAALLAECDTADRVIIGKFAPRSQVDVSASHALAVAWIELTTDEELARYELDRRYGRLAA